MISPWHDFKISIGEDAHLCRWGNHYAFIEDFDEDTTGICNTCKPLLAAETIRQNEQHQRWLVWRNTPEGKLIQACADVVNEEKALDWDDAEDLDYGNRYNHALRRVARLAGIPMNEAYDYAHRRAVEDMPIR